MANTIFRNKNIVRPKKSGVKRRQRQKIQKQRLLSLGAAPEKVEKMTPKEIRDMLKRPKKVQAAQ